MKQKTKIGALLVACVITVLTLTFIQYYLVKNTYLLTKENYYSEVRKSISKITNRPELLALEDSATENLRDRVELYIKGGLDKKEFLRSLKDSATRIATQFDQQISSRLNKDHSLKGVRFKSEYNEIIVQHDGKSDTLLDKHLKPIKFLGSSANFRNAIFLNMDISVTKAKDSHTSMGVKTQEVDLKIFAKQSNYADVSSWRTEVLKRMAGVFIMATTLILAVMVLFFLVFNALLKEKKIAEIKTDFANNVTHELKTPLTSVNLILKSIKRPDVQARPNIMNDLLLSLERQHTKIQKLVDSVLESSMATAIHVSLQEVKIEEKLQQFIQDLIIPDHNLKVKISPDSTVIKTDLSTIEKIMNIFIDNAAKYSERGKPILIEAYLTDKQYLICVTDQGSGIPLRYQKQLFDKFYRVPESDIHTVKGLGIGLYLAKQAATQIGAKLSVHNENGIGCTFKIELPL